MMLVNNETGAVQPVGEAAQVLKARRSAALLHTDAIQGFLKLPFTPKALGVDLLTVSGHKIGAMKGSGALYIRSGLPGGPPDPGGGQEGGLRSGTEPTPQIAALAAGLHPGQGQAGGDTGTASPAEGLRPGGLPPGSARPGGGGRGAGPPHLRHLPAGYPSQVVVRWLSDQGFCLSAGSACHRGQASHVYAAMGLSKPVRDGMLRVSFARRTPGTR